MLINTMVKADKDLFAILEVALVQPPRAQRQPRRQAPRLPKLRPPLNHPLRAHLRLLQQPVPRRLGDNVVESAGQALLHVQLVTPACPVVITTLNAFQVHHQARRPRPLRAVRPVALHRAHHPLLL